MKRRLSSLLLFLLLASNLHAQVSFGQAEKINEGWLFLRAERLGSKKDYTGRVRADFIKRMFPDVMRDIEQDSIRNFKFQPDTGNIVIDEPDKGDYLFHFE